MATVGLSTNGIRLAYAPETTSGTKPTTGWKYIPDIVSIPAIGAAPDPIDVTPLQETEYTQSVKGLRSAGSAEMTANMTDAFMTAWDAAIEAYGTAESTGKTLWFAEIHPNNAKAFFWTGEPVELSLPAASSNTAWQPTPTIIVGRVQGWDTKPEIE